MTPELEQEVERMVKQVEALRKAISVMQKNPEINWNWDAKVQVRHLMKALDEYKDDLVHTWIAIHNANCEKAKDSMVIVGLKV